MNGYAAIPLISGLMGMGMTPGAAIYSAWQNHPIHAELNHTTSNPKRLFC